MRIGKSVNWASVSRLSFVFFYEFLKFSRDKLILQSIRSICNQYVIVMFLHLNTIEMENH